jgi:hypothetical protein
LADEPISAHQAIEARQLHEASAMGRFEVCPNELLYSVLSLLDVRSLAQLAQTNSTFKLIAEGTCRPYISARAGLEHRASARARSIVLC